MKYLRPFDPSRTDQAEWILRPDEEFGCAIRVGKGGAKQAARARLDVERLALALTDGIALVSEAGNEEVFAGDLVFIPVGAAGAIAGDADAAWIEIEAPTEGAGGNAPSPRVIRVDHSRFEGSGFAYQALIEKAQGARTMRVNTLQVTPGSGSPDFHIHAFAQIYVIQQGEMTLDIGRSRLIAGANTLVVLPAGVVHRNFNASDSLERHISLLVPEPAEGAVLDYAVTIHEEEAELLTAIPA